jgi:hypothetical protein
MATVTPHLGSSSCIGAGSARSDARQAPHRQTQATASLFLTQQKAEKADTRISGMAKYRLQTTQAEGSAQAASKSPRDPSAE